MKSTESTATKNILNFFFFYVLNNNFFYTRVVFAYVPDNTDTIFLFLFDSEILVFLRPFIAFCPFLLQKDFDIFHVLLFVVFFCAFDNTCLPFFYIEKKIIKNFYISIFKILFIGIFF